MLSAWNISLITSGDAQLTVQHLEPLDFESLTPGIPFTAQYPAQLALGQGL